MIVTLALLVAVLIPGIGTRVNGAQRWLRYGPMSLQPSELAKIALPLFVCRWLVRYRQKHLGAFLLSFPVVLPIALVAGLVILEPDLGTAIFLVAGAGAALFVGGWPLRSFFVSAAVALPALVTFVSLRPYQIRRLTGFIASWTDPSETPYQIAQSLLSLGAGGLTGSGLGKGWQKLSFLPEANTDFVFAVAGEELGLIGTLSLVAVWVGLYATGIRLLGRLNRTSFGYIVGFTLLTQLVLQAALNVAVVTGTAPSKGIPHPLISYGGSNLVVSLLSLGIIVSVSSNSEVGLRRAQPSGSRKSETHRKPKRRIPITENRLDDLSKNWDPDDDFPNTLDESAIPNPQSAISTDHP
jgi:cell division protein FtsW